MSTPPKDQAVRKHRTPTGFTVRISPRTDRLLRRVAKLARTTVNTVINVAVAVELLRLDLRLDAIVNPPKRKKRAG